MSVSTRTLECIVPELRGQDLEPEERPNCGLRRCVRVNVRPDVALRLCLANEPSRDAHLGTDRLRDLGAQVRVTAQLLDETTLRRETSLP